MTQLEAAANGIITDEVQAVALDEGLEPEELRRLLAAGRVVIPANPNHRALCVIGIGESLRVKINANLGTSPENVCVEHELAKLDAALSAGADAVMDLSIAGDLNEIRRTILSVAKVPVGTVPIYQLMTECREKALQMDGDALLATVELQGRQGVDFVTLHCGITRAALPLIRSRVMGIVSRGGSFLAHWMDSSGLENPLYERFDDVLDIARRYDLTLSLGDALRPGAIADASDAAQFHELQVLGELTQRARRAGVQVMIEGPGHVPLNQIERNVRLEQELCDHAPFYVLGPLTTDVAPGYDHICGAIGGALAAYFGAAFLCYVTPAEHLRLPSVEDVREGVIASKIAAHSADLAHGRASAWEWDLHFSQARRSFDWEEMFSQAIDSRKPRQYRAESSHAQAEECSMCGPYCAMKLRASSTETPNEASPKPQQ